MFYSEQDLDTLRSMASRCEADGTIAVHSAEVPFVLSQPGARWFDKVNGNPTVVTISAHGRRALEQ